MSIAGLIVAAGESRRMGSPKALLPFRGETFIDGLIARLAPHCAPVIVVLGGAEAEIRRGMRRAGEACIVVNPDYLRGQITSMQRGLREAPPDSEGVLFTLVDHPNVNPETVARLAAPPLPLLRIPRYLGRRGHPVFFRRELVPELLGVPADGSARDVVARYEPAYIDVQDPGVLDDIDDPDAYRRLVEGAGSA